MFKTFLCAVAIAVFPSVSFGALLVSYPITVSSGFAPVIVEPGFAASTGVRNTLGGSGAGGVYTTGATVATTVDSSKYAIFSISNIVNERFQIERVEFSVKVGTGTGSLVISSDATSPAYSNFGAVGAVTSTTFVPVSIPYNLDAVASGGKSWTMRLYTISGDGSSFTAVIDSIDIYGKVVPEPTSVAIFGLLATGGLFLKRRRPMR